MKITIAYLPEEERLALIINCFLQSLCPDNRTRTSERHPPYRHIYLATKKPGTPCGTKENA